MASHGIQKIVGAKTADDLHGKKAQFERLEKKVNALSDEGLDSILKKYCAYHRMLAEQGTFTWNACERSVRIAWDFVNTISLDSTNVDDPNFQKKIELWWVDTKKREIRHRNGGDGKGTIKRSLSNASISKIQNQVQKFLKFVKHVNKGREPNNFNSKIAIVPEEVRSIFQYLPKNEPRHRQVEPSASQILDFIKYLRESPTPTKIQLAAIVSVLYDTGMRFSECVTLKMSSIRNEKTYFIADLESTKTNLRSNILFLSTPFLKRWLNIRPKKADSDLLFCTKTGELVNYENLAHIFKKELVNYNKKYPEKEIQWFNGKSFHYFRHMFASRSHEWSDTHRNYYLGWQQVGQMKNYGNIGLEHCRDDYFKMIEKEKNPMIEERVHDYEKIVLTQESNQRSNDTYNLFLKFVEENEKLLEKKVKVVTLVD